MNELITAVGNWVAIKGAYYFVCIEPKEMASEEIIDALSRAISLAEDELVAAYKKETTL